MKINDINLNEDFLEQEALATLQALGWAYKNGKDILPDDTLSIEGAWRSRSDEVVLKPVLARSIHRLNPQLPEATVDEVVKTLCGIEQAELTRQNQTAYDLLKKGVKVSYQKDGEQVHDVARIIDFQTPDNNDFLAVNQLTIAGKKGNRRPDVIGYINGLPVVVFELKNPFTESADIGKAYSQLQTYKDEIGDLFVYNQALVISDGTQARLGSLTADFGRFTPWRVVDEKHNSQRVAFENELDGLLRGIMSPYSLLDYIQNFVVYVAIHVVLLRQSIGTARA